MHLRILSFTFGAYIDFSNEYFCFVTLGRLSKCRDAILQSEEVCDRPERITFCPTA